MRYGSLMAWALIAVMMFPLPSGAVQQGGQDDRPPGGHIVENATIVDVNGVEVGPLIGDPRSPYVILRAHDRIFSVPIRTEGFGSDHLLLFALPDCAGPPFRNANTVRTRLVPPAVIYAPGSTIYLDDASGLVQSMISRSHGLGFIPPGKPQCVNQLIDVVDAVPAVPIIDLDTLFTPPFSIRDRRPGN
jgi:hypothetical protein